MTPPDLPGLSPNTMAMLWALVENGAGEPMRAVSILRDVNEKSARRMCRRLEFWGLVRVQPRGREGQRGLWVEPTFLGRRVIERAAEQPMSAAKAAK